MGKYCGQVGFAVQKETAPGIWEEVIEERLYSGEVLDNRWRISTNTSTNPDLILNCDFSLIIDPYMVKNHAYIAYITYMGTKWTITGAVPNYPRMILTAGGVYNENERGSTELLGESYRE